MFSRNSIIFASCSAVARSKLCFSSMFVSMFLVSIADLLAASVITISLARASKFEVTMNCRLSDLTVSCEIL